MIRSRLLADRVEAQVKLQRLYHFPKHEKAIEMLTKAVKAEDSATEGLLTIAVNLPGPPALSPDSAQRKRVQQATEDAANAYQAALSDYFAYSDNDRDSVILRGAQEYRLTARRDYDTASRASGFCQWPEDQ